MTWRDLLRQEHARRLAQIENYESEVGAGYRLDSDQGLVIQLARELDTQERIFAEWRKRYTPWWLRIIQSQAPHAYTCRLFKRIDFVIYWLMLKRPYWKNGRLFIGNYEANSFFPIGWYGWASDIQNQKIWTRLFLNM